MKMDKKMVNLMQKGGSAFMFALLSKSVFANDLLARALEGDVKDTLGGNAKFWTIFIVIDVILATAMALKSRNPMVFAGVLFIAFIPTFLVKTFVF
ncbi:TPA: hypothetical protein JBJ22_12160 [Legionella pneumophila]|nr:hypothetical protein [Legionella pneumophila]